jgi:hypothetical protein
MPGPSARSRLPQSAQIGQRANYDRASSTYQRPSADVLFGALMVAWTLLAFVACSPVPASPKAESREPIAPSSETVTADRGAVAEIAKQVQATVTAQAIAGAVQATVTSLNSSPATPSATSRALPNPAPATPRVEPQPARSPVASRSTRPVVPLDRYSADGLGMMLAYPRGWRIIENMTSVRDALRSNRMGPIATPGAAPSVR